MKYFTHFEDGIFTLEATYRKPEYYTGEFADIFEPGAVVVSLDVCQLKDMLRNGEILRSLKVSQQEIERTWESLPY